MQDNFGIAFQGQVSNPNGELPAGQPQQTQESAGDYNVNIGDLLLEETGTETSENAVQSQKTQQTAEGDQFDIDPKFSHLPKEEALLRTFQSRYDKLSTVHQELAQKVQDLEKLENLFSAMTQDEGLLLTFVNQIKPGLVPQKDFGELIKEKIRQEFGEDYKPTLTRLEAERDDPGGLDWKYYERLDQLKQEYMKGNPEVASSVKEYLERKQKEQEKEQIKLKQEIETVKKELNVSDDEIKGTLNWYENLKLKDLIVLNRFLRKFPTTKAGNIVKSPGTGLGSSSRQQFIKSIFG